MTFSSYPPGWYPDPRNQAVQRWWDGERWTDQSRAADLPANPPGVMHAEGQASTAALPFDQPRPAASHSQFPQNSQPLPPVSSFKTSLMRQNQQSVLAMGVAAAYIAVAITIHFVLIGIVPLFAAIRAIQRREKLAPLAMAFAVITIFLSFAVFR